MAFDPSGHVSQTSGDVWGFIKNHPMGIAIAVGALVILFILLSKGGSAAAPTSVAVPVDPTADAAAVQSSQIAANAQTALGTIAAGVTNNQTAAAQTVALATIQGQNDSTAAAATANIASSYYGAATAISESNTAAAIAQTQAQAAEQISGNSTTASEFANLAQTITAYGGNTQSILNGLNTTGASLQHDVVSSVSGGTNPSAMTFTPTGLVTTPALDLSGLAAVGGQAGYYGAVASVNQHNVDLANAAATNTNIAASNTAGQLGVANANASIAASQAASVGTVAASSAGIFAGLTGAASNGISTMTGWLSQLTGAFGVASKAAAPVTPSVNLSALQTANNALLTGNPTFFANH
jgi:hypothetical protein